MKRTGLASLIGVKLKYFVFLIDFLSINSLINQQPSSFASFKPGLKDGAHHYIKGQASHGLQKPRVHQVVRWQNGSRLACHTQGSRFISPFIHWKLSPLLFLLAKSLRTIFVVSRSKCFIHYKCAIFRCAKLLMCMLFLCNYPNVQLSECATILMCI